MIIYNRKEMPSKFTLSDNSVFDITSKLSLGEIYDYLRKGEIPPEEVKVYLFVNGDGKVRLESDNMPEKAAIGRDGLAARDDGSDVYLGIDEKLEENTIDVLKAYKIEHTPEREEIFKAVEQHLYGNEVEGYLIKKVPFDMEKPQHREVLRRHIALSSGIMPEIYSKKDEQTGEFSVSYDDAVKYSKDGLSLYRDFGKTSVGKDNPLPGINDIAYYRTMNEYEKRLASLLTIHPMKVVELKKALEIELGNKEKGTLSKGVVISTDLYQKLLKDPKDIDAIVKEKASLSKKQGVQELSDAFFEEYKFRPQVVPEYLEGARLAEDKRDFKELAKAFSRPSVSAPVFSYVDENTGKEVKITVAQTKNPALIYLSSKINFAEVPQQLVRAMSVYVNPGNIKELEKKGFSEWVKANKDTSVADFIEMLENVSTIDKFDPTLSAKEHSNYLDIALGKRDCQLFERMYGYSFADNEIAIKGRNLVVKQGNITMRMLKANDYKNFVTGYDSCCCQRWDDGDYHKGGENYKKQVLSKPATPYHNAGGTCVAHLTSDPFAANVVIERNGKVVGQSYVWTDEAQGIFVFDNIEWANDGDIKPYLNIIGVYVKNLPYNNVQLGMGCTQGLNGVGTIRKVPAHMPTTIKTNLPRVYSDYHSDARDLKKVYERTGESRMVKFDINESICQVIKTPDEPTKWDVLASPQFSFMLNDNSKTLEQRLEIAQKFIENPTVELQKEVFAHYPQAILSIDNPDPALQMEMYEKHPEIAKEIKRPCPALTEKILEDDPEKMRDMEAVPEEIAIKVLQANGLLIDCIENPTATEVNTAVSQNGYAIMNLLETHPELINENIKMAAVTSQPKVITLFDNPSEECQMIAAEKDPESIALMMAGDCKPCIRAQMSAVRRNPQIILRDQFKDAGEGVVRCAIQSDPKIIQKFQYKYPELRMEAIEKNGFVIRGLSGVTPEEYEAAVRQNPAVERLIPPPRAIDLLPEETQADGFEII